MTTPRLSVIATMTNRLAPERLAEIRYNVNASPAYRVPNEVVVELLAELDAVTAERDAARKITDAMVERAAHVFGEQWSPATEWRSMHVNERIDLHNTMRVVLEAAFALRSSDSAASNEGGKPEERCYKLVSFGQFCAHPKEHTGPCETDVCHG